MSNHKVATLGTSKGYSSPSEAEIAREALYLDAYGMEVSPIIVQHRPSTERYVSFNTDMIADLTLKLGQDGWQYAGAGFFSVVFVKDGFALKIGVKMDDTGAMYAAWCRANQDLPGVPRIYGITKFTGCYLVLMKRYQPVTSKMLTMRGPTTHIAHAFEEAGQAIRGRRTDSDDGITGTARKIGEFFKGVADIDLHGENVMLDGTQLVLTDPLSFGPCSLTR